MNRNLPMLILLVALTSCESRGYVAPPAGATPIPTKAPWTLPIAAGPFDAAIPAGAEIGHHWNTGTDSDDVFEAIASLATIASSTWKWRSNFDLDTEKVARASREAMEEARWDASESSAAARFALEGTITALALDTWGPGGAATRARAKVSVDWKLRDKISGAVAASGTSSSEVRDHHPNVIATIIPSAMRSAQYKFMADPAVRALIRKPAAVAPPQP